jgi:hypothetical protein
MQEVLASGVIDEAPRVAFVLRETFFFFLTISGVIVLIAFVVSGILYLISGGNNERIETAKRALYFSIIGSVLILSTLILFYTIVSFLL